MKKPTSSRKFFLAAAVIIIAGLSAVSALLLYNNFESSLIEEKGEKAMSISIAVAELIEQDYSSFEKLLKTEEYTDGNYDSVYYAKMQNVFRDIREKTGVQFLYCGKCTSRDEMVYLFDGEDPDSPLFSHLGTKDNLDYAEQKIYNSKAPGYTPIMDDADWGELLTGMTPIIDPSTGEAVAHVGVDVSVASVYTSLIKVKNIIIFNAFLAFIITSLIIYWLLSLASFFTDTDYLTGLRSKGFLDRFLTHLIKKSISGRKHFPLIMIDFDDFKKINDKYGHQFGDEVLKSVSEIIQICTRSMDCCARYGGDEFVIVLPEADLEYALLLCHWLQKEVSNRRLRAKNDDVVPVSVSIGVALWEAGMTADQLLICADKALYQSKRTGKNKIMVYTEELA